MKFNILKQAKFLDGFYKCLLRGLHNGLEMKKVELSALEERSEHETKPTKENKFTSSISVQDLGPKHHDKGSESLFFKCVYETHLSQVKEDDTHHSL